MEPLQQFSFDRILEAVHENDHYKFKPYQKEGAALKETVD